MAEGWRAERRRCGRRASDRRWPQRRRASPARLHRGRARARVHPPPRRGLALRRRLGAVAALDRHPLAARDHAQGLPSRQTGLPRRRPPPAPAPRSRPRSPARARSPRSSGSPAPIDATPPPSDEWDQDLWALNTPGGVVDLRTGKIRPHDRADSHDQDHDRHAAAATARPGDSSSRRSPATIPSSRPTSPAWSATR